VNATYRCPHCRLLCEPVREGDFMVTLCCDEVAERVWLCEDCGEREQHKGCEQCFTCILDESIADPRTIEMCTPELQAEIAKGLAERLRPFLRVRQAA
jgi:hypothetical protein